LKGEFQEGDLCVYFEIDSILPDVPRFEFVKRGSKKSSALRLRTIKLRGIVSQGLAVPINVLEDFKEGVIKLLVLPQTEKELNLADWIAQLQEGADVTDVFGVTKWEPRSPSGKQDSVSKGNFPFYVPKTDETRIQSVPNLLDEMRGLSCYSTVKLDGCSATYVHRDDEYSVCSRNFALKSLEEKQAFYEQRKAEGKEAWVPRLDRWWEISDRLGLKEKLIEKGNYAVQGEIVGPGLQKNRLDLKELRFFAFNVYDIDRKCYLDFVKFKIFCRQLQIDTVPLEQEFILNEAYTIERLLEDAEGKYSSGFQREGIVIRPKEERRSEVLQGRMSFKVINNKFLLKTGE
jgi:RNA ligase (TIGR02306 family)